MDVFVIPAGPDQYELYCEVPVGETNTADQANPHGIRGMLRRRFEALLRAADERQHQRASAPHARRGWAGRLHARMMCWVAERVAQQRLLWHLRRQSAAVAVHPAEMSFQQVLTLVHRILTRDHGRHRRWLIIDTAAFIASGMLMIVPGPNLIAYYFAFRAWGHWLSMRGAVQGLRHVAWTGRPCAALSELQNLAALEAPARTARIHDIAGRLQLQHLATFFERVAVRHA